ncbi:GyrI-like domain-containing protein [Halobacillus litoralis]|uniref:GyrI-like domain-containing protein n=1 Tax=Halobacillus litoralis TaxID=45668 RepID=UPI001CFD6E10|nr:GyrI-like domain-containing protein [Halobacillus litoralis]
MKEGIITSKGIKDIGEVKIVGYRVVCEGEKYIKEIPKAAQLLKERTKEINHVMNSGKQIGAFVVEESTPEEDGYWIGAQVSKYEDIPQGMTTLTIPPQTYAAILHSGPNREIKAGYEDLHRWIEKEGYTRSNHTWNLEIYHKHNKPEDPSHVLVELNDSIL